MKNIPELWEEDAWKRRYARNEEHIRTPEQEETLDIVEEPQGTPGIPSRTLWIEFVMYNS